MKLGANRSNMSDSYSGDKDHTNGKTNDVFTVYAMMMGSIETWKWVYVSKYWIN